VLDSRNQGPVSSSLGVRLLFRARLLRTRPSPFSDPARLRAPSRSRVRVRLSWGSCSPRNASTPGAPARPNGFEAVREGEGRQTLAGAVLRVLAPLDGSGCARGTARALAELAVTPWRPDASRSYYIPLASLWSCPTELSLPEEPYLLSQAVASLRVRIPTTASATREDASRSLSPPRQLFAVSPPGGGRRRMSRGRRFPAFARLAPRTHSRVPARPALSFPVGLAG